MSEFESSGPVRSAFEQLEALTRATTAAAAVTATVEHDLVTLTVGASPHLEAVDYPFARLRGVDAETLAEATRTALEEALVQVQAAQAEALRGTPLGAMLQARDPADLGLDADEVDRARRAAERLAGEEHHVRDPEGRVEVTVDGAGVLTRLWLSATATRESAAEWLPETVRTTLNQAFARAREAQQGVLGDEGASLEARLDDVVGAAEARLDGLASRLDEVSRRLDGL